MAESIGLNQLKFSVCEKITKMQVRGNDNRKISFKYIKHGVGQEDKEECESWLLSPLNSILLYIKKNPT